MYTMAYGKKKHLVVTLNILYFAIVLLQVILED